MDSNTKLSKNFTLGELLRSDKAEQLGYTEQYTPPLEVINKLQALTQHVLQPIRDGLGQPIKITSGYRCPRLNKAVGGKPASQHQKGEAADINLGSKELNKKLYDWIKHNLDFDQLINEYNLTWVHVSYKSGANRKQEVVVK